MAEAVIGGALLIVLQDVIGFVDFLELRFGLLVARIAVGVKLHGQLAIGLLQLLRAGALGTPRSLVIVLLRHGRQLLDHKASSRGRKAMPSRPAGLAR